MRTRPARSPSRRGRALPVRSRVTVRRAGVGGRVVRSTAMAAALRASREALTDIEGQLEALLAVLRDPGAALDASVPERLQGATRDAGSALATLTELARRP
jgi:hypothetical protein